MAVNFTSYRSEVESSVKEAISRALEICGGTAEGYAKQLCPVDTGNLRNSISHAPQGPNTESIGTNVHYAPYVELGTSRMRAQPYLRPAVENHRDEYASIIKGELNI